MPTRRVFTEQEQADAKRWRAEGVAWSEIGRRLKCSRDMARRAAKVCQQIGCENEPALGKARCAAHLAMARARGAKRVANGQCRAEGCRNDPAPKRVYCEAHLTARREREATIDAERSAVGMCRRCGNPVNAQRSTILCTFHLAEQRERTFQREVERLANGQCRKCGCPHDVVPGNQYCRSHLAVMRDRAVKRATKRIAAGMCRRCGAPPTQGKTFCAEHLARVNTSSHIRKKSVRRATPIKPGHPLRPRFDYIHGHVRRLAVEVGIEADSDVALDHVVPIIGRKVGTYGLHVPANWQLLDGPTNSGKGNHRIAVCPVGREMVRDVELRHDFTAAVFGEALPIDWGADDVPIGEVYALSRLDELEEILHVHGGRATL